MVSEIAVLEGRKMSLKDIPNVTRQSVPQRNVVRWLNVTTHKVERFICRDASILLFN